MINASHRLRRFVEHPMTRLGVGLILFGTGFAEAWQTLFDDLAHMSFGAHHGIMVFGLFNMVASIPDIIDGVGSGVVYLEHLEKRREERSGR